MNKKVLVLGGSGFIGASLISKLSNTRKSVISLSKSPPQFELENVVYLIDYYENTKLLSKTLKQVDTVIHVASETTPGSSAFNPMLEIENNVAPTILILEILQNYKDIHFIYISSGGALYSESHPPPFSEETVLGPSSYYGAGKSAVESFLHAYQKQSRNSVTILRPSNLYGRGQVVKRNFGIIPALFNAVLNNQEIAVWGDGRTTRDFLHISDFVSFCVKVISTNPKNTINTYNVGSGNGVLIADLCEMVERITNCKLQIKNMPIRDIDKTNVVLNIEKAKADFNWQPETHLETGLQDLWSQDC